MTSKPPPTRLTAEQATQIASDYLRYQSLEWPGAALVSEGVREVDGKLVWTLRTPTKGRWLTVGVDDATGEILGHQVHGVR